MKERCSECIKHNIAQRKAIIVFYMGLYLFFSYFLIGLCFAFSRLFQVIRQRLNPVEAETSASPSSSARRWRRIRIALVLLLPLMPYFVVESQTLIYGARVMPGAWDFLARNYESDQIVSLKVLAVRRNEADIFVVTRYVPIDLETNRPLFNVPKQYISLTCTVIDTTRGWRWKSENSYDVPWSDGGNADGNIFPPYPMGDEWAFR